MENLKPLIIAGPTASGKSAYALEYAQANNGVILNGDSMQVYKELPILTAQPSPEDMKLVPHKLYGVLAGNDPCTVARWRKWVVSEIQHCAESGKLPMVVGGSGLYLSSLVNGLSAVPDIDPDIRHQARQLMDEIGAESFHEILSKADPEIAKKLSTNDRQRQLRAYEVILSTGKSLLDWHNMPLIEPAIDCDIRVIERPREELHQRCKQRFDQMLEHGAIEEVKQLISLNYSADLPVMKALGVPELTAFIEGKTNRAEAKELSVIATRQYIKRQSTWFKNQFPTAKII